MAKPPEPQETHAAMNERKEEKRRERSTRRVEQAKQRTRRETRSRIRKYERREKKREKEPKLPVKKLLGLHTDQHRQRIRERGEPSDLTDLTWPLSDLLL